MNLGDDLAQTMVGWHLKQTARWLLERMRRVSPVERERLFFEFKADLTAALMKLEREAAK